MNYDQSSLSWLNSSDEGIGLHLLDKNVQHDSPFTSKTYS